MKGRKKIYYENANRKKIIRLQQLRQGRLKRRSIVK